MYYHHFLQHILVRSSFYSLFFNGSLVPNHLRRLMRLLKHRGPPRGASRIRHPTHDTSQSLRIAAENTRTRTSPPPTRSLVPKHLRRLIEIPHLLRREPHVHRICPHPSTHPFICCLEGHEPSISWRFASCVVPTMGAVTSSLARHHASATYAIVRPSSRASSATL